MHFIFTVLRSSWSRLLKVVWWLITSLSKKSGRGKYFFTALYVAWGLKITAHKMSVYHVFPHTFFLRLSNGAEPVWQNTSGRSRYGAVCRERAWKNKHGECAARRVHNLRLHWKYVSKRRYSWMAPMHTHTLIQGACHHSFLRSTDTSDNFPRVVSK